MTTRPENPFPIEDRDGETVDLRDGWDQGSSDIEQWARDDERAKVIAELRAEAAAEWRKADERVGDDYRYKHNARGCSLDAFADRLEAGR